MDSDPDLLTLTADIVSAHVGHNSVAVGDLATLIEQVHGALARLATTVPEVPPEKAKAPVVSARASIRPDYLVCMECGKRQKMLKRHLQTAHAMSPPQYRKDYGLPKEYPMVAPNYAASRRELAISIGLGRKREDPPITEPPADAAKPKTMRRRNAPTKPPLATE